MTYWASAQVQNARARHSKAKGEWEVVDWNQDESPLSTRFQNPPPPGLGVPAPGAELEVVYENQRWWPFVGWATPAAGDPSGWTTKHGWKAVPPNLYECPSPNHTWWQIEGETADGGWSYAFDFRHQFHPGCGATDMVRRRAWVRHITKTREPRVNATQLSDESRPDGGCPSEGCEVETDPPSPESRSPKSPVICSPRAKELVHANFSLGSSAMSTADVFHSMMSDGSSAVSDQEEQKRICDQFLAEEQQRALIASQHKMTRVEAMLQGDLDGIASDHDEMSCSDRG